MKSKYFPIYIVVFLMLFSGNTYAVTTGLTIKTGVNYFSETENVKDIQDSEYRAKVNTAITTNETQLSNFGKGFFYGFLCMLILLNVVCFLIFQEKLYLLYGALLFAVELLLLSSDSIVTNINSSLIVSISLVSMTWISIPFTLKYLKLEDKNNIKVIVNSVAIISTMFTLSYLITVNEASLTIANVLAATTLLALLVAGIAKFSSNSYSKFYVIAHTIPLLLVIDFFILQSLNIAFIEASLIHVKGALLVEMFIMTYAILFRMKAIKEANEIKKIEMQIFLKNQETMNRKNIETLMQDVYLENLIMNHDLDGMDIKLLQYISEGKNNTKIARKLKISENDLQDHITELYYKLEVENHIQEDHSLVESQPDYIYN